MKKILLPVTLFIAVSVCFAVNIQEKELSIFAAVNAIESKFTMSKYTFIADRPLVSKGYFYYQKPDKLYWEYETPYSYGFLISEGSTFSWQEKDGKRESKDITSRSGAKEMAALLHIFVSMDMEKISKMYTVEHIDNGIVLHPKNKTKKQMILDIKIFFAENIIAVREVVISERSGDKTVITFTDTKIDSPLPQNAFTI